MMNSSLRPSTIPEIVQRAKEALSTKYCDGDSTGNGCPSTVNFIRYLSDAKKHRKQGLEDRVHEDFESAFFQLACAAILILERIPLHKDYMTVIVERQRRNLALNGQAILGHLGRLKPILVGRYCKWLWDQHRSDIIFNPREVIGMEASVRLKMYKEHKEAKQLSVTDTSFPSGLLSEETDLLEELQKDYSGEKDDPFALFTTAFGLSAFPGHHESATSTSYLTKSSVTVEGSPSNSDELYAEFLRRYCFNEVPTKYGMQYREEEHHSDSETTVTERFDHSHLSDSEKYSALQNPSSSLAVTGYLSADHTEETIRSSTPMPSQFRDRPGDTISDSSDSDSPMSSPYPRFTTEISTLSTKNIDPTLVDPIKFVIKKKMRIRRRTHNEHSTSSSSEPKFNTDLSLSSD